MESSIHRLEDKLGEIAKTRNPLQRSFVKGSLFVKEIMDFPTPAKFKSLVVSPKCDGKTDPVLHIEKYQATTNNYPIPNEMRCRAFSGTITGSAQIWYNGLPRGQICSFNQLSELFINNFCFGAKPVKRVAHLLSVRQKEGESTRDYITRFNNEKLEVVDYEEKIEITTLMSGLLPKKLYYTLTKVPPKKWKN